MYGTKHNILAAFAAVTVTAAMGGAIVAAAPTRARGAGELRDLQLAVGENANVQPFDHATAQVVAIEQDGSTTVTLKVQGIDHDVAGTTYGAHVHTGACAVGNGSAAGPHFNH